MQAGQGRTRAPEGGVSGVGGEWEGPAGAAGKKERGGLPCLRVLGKRPCHRASADPENFGGGKSFAPGCTLGTMAQTPAFNKPKVSVEGLRRPGCAPGLSQGLAGPSPGSLHP